MFNYRQIRKYFMKKMALKNDSVGFAHLEIEKIWAKSQEEQDLRQTEWVKIISLDDIIPGYVAYLLQKLEISLKLHQYSRGQGISRKILSRGEMPRTFLGNLM